MISEREAGEPTTPDSWEAQRLPAATVVLAFALIATAKEFRASWRPRLRRLGVGCLARVHALADGAGWLWKAVQRSPSGCVQTLDFFHACQHLSRCGERVSGEQTDEARAADEHSRGLLARQGWAGVCHWVGELPNAAADAERERRRKATDRPIGYFAKQTTRLNYAERLRAGRAIGSGRGEGEAKALGLRLKRRGARWNRCNVQPLASLVCVHHTCQWDAYWALAV